MPGSVRRVLLAVAALVTVNTAVPSQTQTPTWPSRPIRLVVPYPPGGRWT